MILITSFYLKHFIATVFSLFQTKQESKMTVQSIFERTHKNPFQVIFVRTKLSANSDINFHHQKRAKENISCNALVGYNKTALKIERAMKGFLLCSIFVPTLLLCTLRHTSIFVLYVCKQNMYKNLCKGIKRYEMLMNK